MHGALKWIHLSAIVAALFQSFEAIPAHPTGGAAPVNYSVIASMAQGSTP